MNNFFSRRSFVSNFMKLSMVFYVLFFVNSREVLAQSLDAKSYKITHESKQAASDGKLIISLQVPYSGEISVKYEYNGLGNFQKISNLNAINGSLIIENLNPGKYYNVRILSENSSLLNNIDSLIINYGRPLPDNRGERATCGTINFTDCNGNAISKSGLETGKAYNIDNSVSTPCGFEVSSSCTIISKKKWQCIAGNSSSPGAYTDHTITNYSGVGLSALTAARLAWIICHYNVPSSDSDPVALAVWYLTGTGGSANSIYNAAVAAVTSPNGTQNKLVFYKRKYSTNQDFVKWECSNIQKTCQLQNVSLCDGSVSNQGPWMDLRFNGVYQPGYTVLSASIIEYDNGTASIVAQIQNLNNNNIKFNLNVLLSGKNLNGPSHFNTTGGECTTSPKPDWYYYNNMGGTLTGVSGSLMNGAILIINQTSMGTPVQIGTGAAFYSTTAFQLSSWMDMTIVTQPTTGQTITNGGNGTDLYFDIVGCSCSNVSVNAGLDIIKCYGQSTNLTAVGAGGITPYTYSWSNSLGTGPNKTVNPTTTTTYTVTLTDLNSCTATDQVTVVVNPQLNLVIPNDEVCSGANYTKTVQATGGTPGYTYNWSGGLGVGNQKSIPATNGSHTVTVTDSKGCTAIGSFTVTINTLTATASNDGNKVNKR
ncbi:MAG: SprB repeat-containing protein [Saprospiraceae bacterium]|nr:SprB repeat-containing protein [Saprospiraceae bacterium]